MVYRTKKSMHHVCRECGVKFERIGRFTRYCNSCRIKRAFEARKRAKITIRKKREEQSK